MDKGEQRTLQTIGFARANIDRNVSITRMNCLTNAVNYGKMARLGTQRILEVAEEFEAWVTRK